MATISPSVEIDDQTVHPPGWMYVFAYAMRGCRWAERQVLTADFDAKVRAWFKEREAYGIEQEIEEYENQIAALKERKAQLIKNS